MTLTVAHQAALSVEVSRQGYWWELPFLLQGIALDPGMETSLLHCGQIVYNLTVQIVYSLLHHKAFMMLLKCCGCRETQQAWQSLILEQ